jgi:hypothetical protein
VPRSSFISTEVEICLTTPRPGAGTASIAAGWRRTIEGDWAMGRNVTLGIGTLIIILIVVALIF